jgi:hypothetical protein
VGSWFPDKKPQKIERQPKGPSGACYWNVHAHVNQQGGQLVLGWWIGIWHDVLFEALHHAVWRHPCGQLIDISAGPYPANERSKISIFVPEERPGFDFSFSPCVQSKFSPLPGKNAELAERYSYHSHQKIEFRARIQRIFRKMGFPNQDAVPPAIRSLEENSMLLGQENVRLGFVMEYLIRGKTPGPDQS